MGSYTDMFALQMCIITLRFVCVDPNDIVDGSVYMLCVGWLRNLHPALLAAGHWFPHCPVSTAKATQMAVLTCNLPRNACRRLLEKIFPCRCLLRCSLLFYFGHQPLHEKMPKSHERWSASGSAPAWPCNAWTMPPSLASAPAVPTVWPCRWPYWPWPSWALPG